MILKGVNILIEFFFFLVGKTVTIYYYFNKSVSQVSIFHQSLNDKDQNDIRMKGWEPF